jgi:hypothetical protein
MAGVGTIGLPVSQAPRNALTGPLGVVDYRCAAPH